MGLQVLSSGRFRYFAAGLWSLVGASESALLMNACFPLRTCLTLVSLALAATPARAQDWEKLLDAKDPLQRVEGIDKLLRQRPAGAEELLREALEDRDWEVVEKAAQALQEVGTTADSAEALTQLTLEGPVLRIRQAAARALAGMVSRPVLELLVKEAKGRKQPLRALQALALLAPEGHEDAIEILEKALASSEADPRRAAAYGLGAFEPAERLEWLGKLLQDKDLVVVDGALRYVSDHPQPAFLPLLLDALTAKTLTDVIERRLRATVCSLFVADAAALTADLGKWSSGQAGAAAHVLTRVVRLHADLGAETRGEGEQISRHMELAPVEAYLLALASHADTAVRAAVMHALGRLRSVDGMKRMLEVAASDPEARVRATALRTLAQQWSVEHPRIEAVAIERLTGDASAEVRELAAVLVGKPGRKAALPALQQALGDSDWKVSVCAAVSLGKIGDDAALPLLRELLRHKDWKRQGAAFAGLGHLQSKQAIPDLIEGLGERPAAVHHTVEEYLRRLTSEKVKSNRGSWTSWWKSNASTYEFPRSEDADKYGYGASSRAIYDNLDVIVFQSRGDHIELLLDELEIPYRTTRMGEVGDVGLHPQAVYVSNCTGEASADDAEPLSWFVRTGGYLFSSCWALTHTVNHVVEGKLRQLHTPGQVMGLVEASPCPVDSPFLKGVFDGKSRPVYTLEGAHLIEVLDPELVEVLIDSPSCATVWGEGNLAAWLPVGHGLILDSVNHFDLQGFQKAPNFKKADERRAYAIDRLGISYEELREYDRRKIWDSQKKTAELARDLSAFRFLTNFVAHKRRTQ